ncbi:hypothetical protein CSW47_10770 [Thermus scotoductus]|uniref:Uncharacterized protein n=1 Tax=Thermus scotoductus TaxID=37636 RepID=A0A430R4Y5_THESC|nr:hypothetical protein [Thermus scotoductus]RTH02381.1 hypothetical protein CSW47_10770 [Thermus scotoductus]
MVEALEFIEANARLIRLEAVKLMEFYRDNPQALRVLLPEVKALAVALPVGQTDLRKQEELNALRDRLYRLHVRVKKPLEDNSAEALRREFF